ncbi:MAG: right-handed parallel beta-helix repeat-containing protein, partial [Planctomycetales bacterium]|nr:right-handed parallel beta-helix repeat-containing protein [Planctomycetales bacterium]
MYHSDVTFSKCEFDKLYYGVHGQYTGTKLVGCYIHDCDGYAAMNHYGGLDINGCNITNNANGPRSYRDHYFAIKNSRIEKTSSWAIMCAFDPYGTHQPFGANTPLVSNCEIVDSGNGVHLALAKPKDFIRFVNSTIRNVAGWQLGIDDSELTINPEWMKLWPFEGEKRHGLLTWQSKLSVFDLVLEGYSGQAFYSRSDELTMSNCISRMNGQGLDVYYPKRADLKHVQIVNNNVANTSGWGLRLWVNDDSPATLRNCVIDGNRYGAYIHGATDSTLRLINTSISNNVSYGAYCERSEVILTPATMETRWRLKNNGYGVVCNYGRLSMEDVTMADCSGWAVMAHHSDVSIRNCN